MPLIDPFGRAITYLRISVTDRCNLRCTYCMPDHPHHVLREDVLRFEEIDRLVRIAVMLGWKKVRLTGGEPLVRKDCVELVRLLARHKGPGSTGNRLEQLVMSTNGVLLGRYAPALREAGLDRVNVSLDTLDPVRFHKLTGYNRFREVMDGLEAAEAADLLPLKINVVLVRGETESEFFDFIDLARSRPWDIRFIEFMPFAGNGWSREKVLTSDDLRQRLRDRYVLTTVEAAPHGGPAKTVTSPGWKGSVSFISPISDRAFCTRCNRVRLTSEGLLRGCLLNENEIDFRAVLRQGIDDEALIALFRKAIGLKPEEHPYHRAMSEGVLVGPVDGRSMHRIGG
ncbi:MAG TPA: GTP 3',8-cyclase MoaA [Candidatus Eisenbacteria bacterium]|nr:GTP 3',8-cyclase MoaA [Candidatus Eisenbacteria bacterium]